MNYDLCLHIDSKDPAILRLVLRNAANYIKALPEERFQIAREGVQIAPVRVCHVRFLVRQRRLKRLSDAQARARRQRHGDHCLHLNV